MTPFEKAGYTKDMRFKVMKGTVRFNGGEIVTLIDDDGTEAPRFINQNNVEAYIYLDSLKPLSNPLDEVMRLVRAVAEGDAVKKRNGHYQNTSPEGNSISVAAYWLKDAMKYLQEGGGYALKSEEDPIEALREEFNQRLDALKEKS